MKHRIVFLTVTLVLVSGCVAGPPDTAERSNPIVTFTPEGTPASTDSPDRTRSWGPLAVVPPQDGVETARSLGTVRIADGCAYLESGPLQLLVWPADRTRWVQASQSVTFTNTDGRVLSVKNGEEVILAGGGGSEGEGGLTREQWAEDTRWVARPEQGCLVDRWWVVGDVIATGSEARRIEEGSEEPQPLPTMPPPPGAPQLDGHMPGLRGGCTGTFFYKTRAIHGDQCGTEFFRDVLALKRLSASRGQRLLIEAPKGYALSVTDAHLAKGWSVTIAKTSLLDPSLAIVQIGIPDGLGRVVAEGLGPDTKVTIRMPTTPGTYVIELDRPVARDGWTFPGELSYWLVRVS